MSVLIYEGFVVPGALTIEIGCNGLRIDETLFTAAVPVRTFETLLGATARTVAAGPPAPVGHRNNQFHYFDDLGLTLIEHHATWLIECVVITLCCDQHVHSPRRSFPGRLTVADRPVHSGDPVSVLDGSGFEFGSRLGDLWVSRFQAPGGQALSLAVRLERTRRRVGPGIQSLSFGLEHDPWETRFRPAAEST